MLNLKQIKYLFISVFTIGVGLFLSLSGFWRGQKSGIKKIQREVKRAEKDRQKTQHKVNEIHNDAVRKAMAIHDDNSVDTFNGLFNSNTHSSED